MHHVRSATRLAATAIIAVSAAALGCTPFAASSNTRPPTIAVDDTASTMAANATTLSVLSNDMGAWDNPTASISMAIAPIHGTAHTNIDNTITYTPDAGFTGADTFQYTLYDVRGSLSSGNVTIDVNDLAATCQSRAMTAAVQMKKQNGATVVTGTPGDDVIVGTPGDDIIYGGIGYNRITNCE